MTDPQARKGCDPEIREQIADQCRVIAHLAEVLSKLHKDYERISREIGFFDADFVGRRSAAFMEQLGDMLNAMDAVTAEDEWVIPIFDRAQELWSPEPPVTP